MRSASSSTERRWKAALSALVISCPRRDATTAMRLGGIRPVPSSSSPGRPPPSCPTIQAPDCSGATGSHSSGNGPTRPRQACSSPPKFQTLRVSIFRLNISAPSGPTGGAPVLRSARQPHFFFVFRYRALAGPHCGLLSRAHRLPQPPPLFSFCGYCSTGHFFSIVAWFPFLDMRFKWHIYKHPRLVSPIRG